MSAEHTAAVARQHLETCLLLGVPFVPVRLETGEPDATGEAGEGGVMTVNEPIAEVAEVKDKAAALEAVRARHDETCPHCTSATAHTRTVFGEGDPDAALMFIGEAPGADEDRTGRPFVGRAGKKLEEIITAMGLRREDVFIANILKSRPPENRTPLQHEVDACATFLAEQIAIIRPRVIVALGGPSAKFLLDTNVGITRLRGQWGSYDDPAAGLSIPIMPTFHPAYLLRNYTEDTRRKVWSDMQAARDRIG